MRKIIVLGALPSSLYNFRGELIKKLSTRYNVISMADFAALEEIDSIENLNCSYLGYPVERNGLNPIKDLITLFSLIKHFREQECDVLLAYTIKPIVWGGIAARFANIDSFYAMITGLGYAFQEGSFRKNILNRLVTFLYRFSLRKSKGVIFQNFDNLETFVELGIVPKEKCFLINGSGVDLSRFVKEPLHDKPHFLLIARLLVDKGIREYYEAATLVKQHYPEAEFHLVGPEDSSPNSINISEVIKWQKKGIIHYHGPAKDVRPFLKACSIFVLPSYHEGMPRTVLEAMAMGRPVLTTNVPGCKETVVNGENGWLVEKANVEQLAERMIWFIENSNQWQSMGDKGHQMAIEKFDVHKVNQKILDIMGL